MESRANIKVLENELSMQILLVIRDNPGSTRNRIYELSPGSKQTVLRRLNEFLEIGLTIEEQSKTHTRGRSVSLSSMGEAVVRQIDALIRCLDGDIENDNQPNYDTPSEQMDTII